MKAKMMSKHSRRRIEFEDISRDDQLPREISPNYRVPQIIFLIAGMLLFVVVVNLLVIPFLGRYSTNYGYFVSNQKWQLLKHIDEPVQWLILGDSSVNQGIIPTMIEEELGGRALNLGTNGDMITLDDLWMMEYYTQKFGPPENVLIVHVYDIWQRDFNPVLIGQMPLSWGTWKDFSLTDFLVWDPEVKRDIFLERYVPVFSQNRTLGNIIQDAFLSFRNPLQSNWQLDPDGYLPTFVSKPEIVVADARDHIEAISEINFQLSDINRRSMGVLQKLADDQGINVYILFGPQYEGLNADPNFKNYLNSIIEQLSEYASKSDYVDFISEVKTFPADKMQNSDHLIDTGAREYTRWVIEKIKMLR